MTGVRCVSIHDSGEAGDSEPSLFFQCGAKDSMVVESEDGSGTKEMKIAPDRKQAFCLTDERAIAIARIGAAV